MIPKPLPNSISPLRCLTYLFGMALLAFGIILSSKTSLGVSPIISVAYISAIITGQKIGNTTFLLYSLFIFAELVIHISLSLGKNEHSSFANISLRNRILMDLLQLPVSLLFTQLMNLFSDHIPVFLEQYTDSFWGSLSFRIMVLLFSVFCIGTGSAFALCTDLIPTPGDGIVRAIASIGTHTNGFIKNIIDLCCISISIFIGIITGSGLQGIGIGTVLSALLTGRVIALWRNRTDFLSHIFFT